MGFPTPSFTSSTDGIALADIDYVVINHMEPVHSGWLADFKKIRGDDFTIVTNKRAVPLL
jgi:flavorubredoxin